MREWCTCGKDEERVSESVGGGVVVVVVGIERASKREGGAKKMGEEGVGSQSKPWRCVRGAAKGTGCRTGEVVGLTAAKDMNEGKQVSLREAQSSASGGGRPLRWENEGKWVRASDAEICDSL